MAMLFDPWPVFFKREWKRCWPFLTGFAVTGVLITKLTAGFTGKSGRSSSEFTESIRILCGIRSDIFEILLLGRRQELQVRPTTQAVITCVYENYCASASAFNPIPITSKEGLFSFPFKYSFRNS
ncbi:hypothetical protein HID58_045899 [Brassica napus]|uniref:Uncharacterized protein n=1 Tax=Brassica napus TaxID=3708 RepID=A0ABQ8AWA4_BRANA|nr:hypothetical protein HID58_045899 [Brassica napus]